MKNPIFAEAHPLTKLLFTAFLMLGGFTIFIVLALAVSVPVFGISLGNLQSASDPTNPENIAFLKFFQSAQSIGLFIVPAMAAAFFFDTRLSGYLHIEHTPQPGLILVSAVVMLLIIPFVNYTAALNRAMNLPDFLSGIEKLMKNAEDKAQEMTFAFLDVQNIGGFIANILIIALIPAIGEELLFRGVLQRIFSDWTRNAHWGIIIGALIFSTIHFQFYGFVPRFLMGVLFGYLVFWSGSLYYSIAAHFVNNAFAVTAYALLRGTKIEQFTETPGGDVQSLTAILFSTLVAVSLMFFFVKTVRKNQT